MQLLTSRIATINRAERINRSSAAFTRRSRFTVRKHIHRAKGALPAPKALKRIAYGEVEAECTGEVGYVVVAAA